VAPVTPPPTSRIVPPTPTNTTTSTSSNTAPIPTAPIASATASPSSSSVAASPTGSTAASPPLFGAVHDRAAVDLSAKFAREFPQASRGEDLWLKAPFGSSGEADVTLTIDESGHVVGMPEIMGAPSLALNEGIMRTFFKIHGFSFTARGARTKLHVSATVTSKGVAAYALGDGPFVDGTSTSFFELPPDRRIDVRIKLAE
jgi:hypothetical protein